MCHNCIFVLMHQRSLGVSTDIVTFVAPHWQICGLNCLNINDYLLAMKSPFVIMNTTWGTILTSMMMIPLFVITVMKNIGKDKKVLQELPALTKCRIN